MAFLNRARDAAADLELGDVDGVEIQSSTKREKKGVIRIGVFLYAHELDSRLARTYDVGNLLLAQGQWGGERTGYKHCESEDEGKVDHFSERQVGIVGDEWVLKGNLFKQIDSSSRCPEEMKVKRVKNERTRAPEQREERWAKNGGIASRAPALYTSDGIMTSFISFFTVSKTTFPSISDMRTTGPD